jgi:hypothetical protein
MPGHLLDRISTEFSDTFDRRWGWDRLPRPLAVLTLLGLRTRLRRDNLYDTDGVRLEWGPERPVADRRLARTLDGSQNDPNSWNMGKAGSHFGRNVPLDAARQRDVLEPNPRAVSNALLTRNRFIPAPTLNLLMAAWIQFEVHDWMSHGPNDPNDPWKVDLERDDPFPTDPMYINRTRVDRPVDGEPATYRNTQSHWWDASQLYGSSPEVSKLLRTGERGYLKLTGAQLLDFDPPRLKDSLKHIPELAGTAAGWWVGLAMFHTLFAREHNAICDELAKRYPHFDDQELFDKARLINAALMAKIHTLEWTAALLAHPTTEYGTKMSWWGVEGRWLRRRGVRTRNEELSGIPGSDLYYHSVPFSLTEEFVSVYRLHPLIPDEIPIRRLDNDRLIEQRPFDLLAGQNTRAVLNDRAIAMDDLFYSFATTNPGALVLHNYPQHLRAFHGLDGVIDLATVDILRDRERGVPRYNEFRRLFRLPAATRFEDFSDDPSVVQALASLYRNPEQVDLMIGLYAEKRPAGFAISETAFRVFLLMAARRLKADRFFTYDYRSEVYTPEGIEWVETNTLAMVLARHYPRLRPELEGVDNVFKPWGRAASGRVVNRWRRHQRAWNFVSRTLFAKAEPLVVPAPDKGEKVSDVPFTKRFPTIPIPGLAVANRFPANELDRKVLCFIRLEEWFARKFPPAQDGLPSIDPDPDEALAAAYPASYRRLYRAPTRPPEYSENIDLGGLALDSPYACYLRHDPQSDRFEWDLAALDRFQLHRGLCSPGVRVEFGRHADGLDATRIDCELGSCTPADRDWFAAQRLAMCALATHVTLVRHFNWIHLVAGERLALVSHRFLPVHHPVRRLLQPHIYATHFGNRIVTPIQLQPAGDFERLFSYTHRGLCQLFEATIADFDLQVMEPDRDASERGIEALQSGALVNRRELMAVIRRHTDRYLHLYFDDGKISQDEPLCAWIDELAVHLRGVKELVDGPPTLDGVGTLLAAFIYMVSVDHEIVDSGVWDYQLWSDVQAPRVYRDGRRLPVDVYQRLVNANFILNVDRTRLMSDFSYLALDPPGHQAFVDFRLDLEDLQRRMDRLSPELWRIEPRNLKANINY